MSEKDNRSLTVSIVTGKYPQYLAGCLSSLPVAAKKTSLKVYVIDNLASFDVTEVIKRNYSEAKIIKNTERKGFGANHNQVLKICDTPYALIINDDIIMGERCIDLLVEFMNNYPSAGLAGTALYSQTWNAMPVPAGYRISHFPLIIRSCITNILKSIGALKFLRIFFGHSKYQLLSADEFGQPLILAHIGGVCCLIRKKVLNEIGLFDEKFFMYGEDLDLGVRARKQGWKCYQVPEAKIIHFVSSSISKKTHLWIYHSERYFVNKHYSDLTKILALLIIAIRQLIGRVKHSR